MTLHAANKPRERKRDSTGEPEIKEPRKQPQRPPVADPPAEPKNPPIKDPPKNVERGAQRGLASRG